MLWIKSTWQRGLQSIEAKNQGAKTWSKSNFQGRANRDMKILLLFTPTKDIQVSFCDITKTIYPALLPSPFFRALLGITVSSDHVGLNPLKVCDGGRKCGRRNHVAGSLWSMLKSCERFLGSRTAEALRSSQSCESRSASFTFSPLRNMLECYDCCKKKSQPRSPLDHS